VWVLIHVDMGLTKCTLPETVLIQIVDLFFHVFCMYSEFLSTDFIYSWVPGDQGGSFFSDKDFFLEVIYVQIGVLQFVARVQFYA
jgi:hypothetical protein